MIPRSPVSQTDKTIHRIVVLVAVMVAFAAPETNATDLVWIGGSANWNAAASWSPAQVPGAADNAFITNAGTYTVTVPANTPVTVGSVSVGGAGGIQTLAIDKTTLTLNGASVINANGRLDFLVSGSTLTGAGNLTVTGTLNWPNGTISGTGNVTIGGGGTLAMGSAGVTLGRTLNNSGTGTWSGGNLTLSAGVVFNNLAGGTFEITADGRLSGAATTPINNSGLFRQTAGTAGTVVTAPFNNTGTLQTLAAVLSLNLGGTHSGIMSNAAGASIQFGGGNHVLTASSLVTGPGVLSVSGGATTLAADGTFDPGSALSITAGTVTLSAGCLLTGTTIHVNSGILNYNSAGPVGALTLSAGTLGGTSPIDVTGPLTLTGGTVTNALVFADSSLSIGGGVTLNGGKLINRGTAIWSAGNFTGANGAVFTNALGATFINTFDGNAAAGAGTTPLWVNDGVFQKTNGTAALGATSIDFHFINTGMVEVQTNTLRYAINQQTAGLTLLDGGGLTAQAQPLQFQGGSLVGTGLVTVANTLNLVNSATISPGLPLGELDISGNFQQTSAGALNIELGGYSPATGFDLVTVTAGGAGGVATLGGTLNVTLTNGFSPTNGATFTFLTAVSRAGAFATFNYPSNDIGMQLNLDPTSATIKVTNLKPLVANPIVDPASITYGGIFSFQFPANTFSDPDNNALAFTASGMPAGIAFTGATRTFSGTPTQAGVFTVAVVAADNGVPSLSVTNTFTITVSPAPIIGSFTAADKVYDGNTNATVLTRSLNGVLPADSANVTLSGGTASFASATAGPGKLVTLTGATLTGSAAGNYSLSSLSTTTAAITKAALSVTADSKTKTYGTADPAFTASYAGFVNGETPALLGGTLNLTRAPGENVGAYLITPNGLTSANYAITFNTGTLAITAPPPVVLQLADSGNGNLLITWSTVTNGTYRVQFNAQLGTTNWLDLPGDVTAAGLTASKQDIKTTTNRFYRIKVVP